MINHQLALFLSTGDFYRSRYAEAQFNHRARKAGLNWNARSRGFHPRLAKANLSQTVAVRLKDLHIPLSRLSAKPAKVNELDLAESSLVIALCEAEHAPMVKEEFPRWMDRIRYWNVPDIDITPPSIALAGIEQEVDALIRQLSAGHALGVHEECGVEF